MEKFDEPWDVPSGITVFGETHQIVLGDRVWNDLRSAMFDIEMERAQWWKRPLVYAKWKLAPLLKISHLSRLFRRRDRPRP